ncbi:MAG: transglycosylase domain-containing protein [Clostridioides sp.]|jgi:penicillin-binding protein 1A|nr:transglycosylase domain-containing protein [Clostridioides sp.]
MNNDNNDNKNKIRRKRVSSSSNGTNTPRNTAGTGAKPSTSEIKRKSNSSETKSVKPSANNKKKKKKPTGKYRIIRNVGIALLVCFVVGCATATGIVFASLKNVQPVTESTLDKKVHLTTKINYANGESLSLAPNITKRTPVDLDEMSKYLREAIISIEDERFYEHNGVDYKGLARSLVRTVTGTKQGASTIPMQVSKVLLTSREQTVTRKIKDLYYANEMSKTIKKDKILEIYLNTFFVGQGLSGAEAGARGYFDKDAADLTLAESALLAGSTKNPSRYSAYKTSKLNGDETKQELEHRVLLFPNTKEDKLDEPTQIEFDMIEKMSDWELINSDEYKQLKAATMVVRKAVPNEEAKERRKTVLDKMLALKKISQSEYATAVSEPINIKLPDKRETVASSVEDYITDEAIKALVDQGNTEEEAKNLFYNGGLIINTTIDPKIQKSIEEEYAKSSNFPHSIMGKDGVVQPQSGMVITDYRNGEIKGLIGGRNIKSRRAYNRAINPHQPGSTIKPLSVYTAAIDTMEITQSTRISNARGGYKFAVTKKWNPHTSSSETSGWSVRKAVEKSSNTIAAKTAEMLGDTPEDCYDIMIDYLENFGISTLKVSALDEKKQNDRQFPSLVLGGMTVGISPLEMSSAYGALANGGVYVKPSVLSTITTYDGQLLFKNSREERKVVDPAVAYVMTDMLEGTIKEGGAGNAKLDNEMTAAGKTGTTNGGKDIWFAGYTPYYSCATYMADDSKSVSDGDGGYTRRSLGFGGDACATLWSNVMSKVHKNLEVKDFEVPDNIYFTRINLLDGGRQSTGSKAAFIDGTSPSRVSSQPSPAQTAPKQPENGNNGTDEEKPAQGNGGGNNPPANNDGGGASPGNDGGGNNPAPPADGGTPPANGGGTQ